MAVSCVITSWQEQVRYHPNPAAIFHQLCRGRMHTLLLESSETTHKKPLESKIIVDSALRITAVNNVTTVTALTGNGAHLLSQLDTIIPKNIYVSGTDHQRIISFPVHAAVHTEESVRLTASPSVFDCLRWLLQMAPTHALASFFFGGLFAYDLVHSFEDIPRSRTQPAPCPDLCFYLAESMIHINHRNKQAALYTHAFSPCRTERRRLRTRLAELRHILQYTEPFVAPVTRPQSVSVTSNISDAEYTAIIDRLRTYIELGEIFQVVPSRQFYCSCADPLAAYRRLTLNNPSPYMFFMQDPGFVLFGASPESYLKYDAITRVVALHPIAGTRPRGHTVDGVVDLDLDNRIELSLRTHQKELAEHLMLVDLARNDLAKVCRTNSRYVSQLMHVEKYSHVMHLVSRVTGILQDHLDVFHAYQSCMNMGTLTGAPKLRAMQLLAQIEPVQRGAYGGSVGYFTGDGSLDTCIVIRSAFVQNNVATVQSGAGIVYESVTAEEVRESQQKAQAVLESIALVRLQTTRGASYV